MGKRSAGVAQAGGELGTRHAAAPGGGARRGGCARPTAASAQHRAPGSQVRVPLPRSWSELGLPRSELRSRSELSIVRPRLKRDTAHRPSLSRAAAPPPSPPSPPSPPPTPSPPSPPPPPSLEPPASPLSPPAAAAGAGGAASAGVSPSERKAATSPTPSASKLASCQVWRTGWTRACAATLPRARRPRDHVHACAQAWEPPARPQPTSFPPRAAARKSPRTEPPPRTPPPRRPARARRRRRAAPPPPRPSTRPSPSAVTVRTTPLSAAAAGASLGQTRRRARRRQPTQATANDSRGTGGARWRAEPAWRRLPARRPPAHRNNRSPSRREVVCGFRRRYLSLHVTRLFFASF